MKVIKDGTNPNNLDTTNKKYFIVSDAHSFYTHLIKTLYEKGFDINNQDHILVVNGDLFDRGDESKQLLEFVKSLKDRFIYVRGNHEDLLQELYTDIMCNMPIGSHHFSNGTVKTVCDLCDLTYMDFNNWGYTDTAKQKISETILPLLQWIDSKALNYFNIDDKYIVTHCWIPLLSNDSTTFPTKTIYAGIYTNWDANPYDLNDRDFMIYHALWAAARWGNPFECWKQKMYLDGKIIVSGHWHTSYGYSHIDMTHKEFPTKNRNNWQDSFRIWQRENFIAIDGCVSYSNIINCLVVEYNDNIGGYTHNV